MVEPPEVGKLPSLRRLDDPMDPAFAGFLGIYAESIPTRERKSPEAMRGLCRREDYRLMVLEAGRQVVGLSVLFIPPGEPFFLLEYMAVASTERNRGLGSGLFRQSLAAAKDTPGRCWALLEVDAVRGGSADFAVCERRQRFYRRMGCLRVEGLSYLLPLPGEGDPPAMDLLIHGPGPQAGEPCHLARAELEKWLAVVYSEVYGCSREDPRLHLMTSRLSEEVVLC